MNSICVDVCVATYKRPELLLELFASLLKLELDGLGIRVIVIDNDSLESARGVVEKFSSTYPLEILYAVEPAQGISHARNRALQLATADYIAFVDDDEIVTPLWLRSLLATLHRYHADVVFGPVTGIDTGQMPTWATKSRAFSRPRHKSGTRVEHGGAGNVLLCRSALASQSHGFNPAYGLTGGEDTDFFHRLFLDGKKLIWCDEAEVYEHVPAERLTIAWLLRRSFRGGQSYARIFVSRYALPRKVLWFVQKVVQILVATCVLPLLMLLSVGGFVRVLCRICAAAGQLSTLFGNNLLFEEYK